MLQSYYFRTELAGVPGVSNEDLKKWKGASDDPFDSEEKIETLVAPNSFVSKEIDAYIEHQKQLAYNSGDKASWTAWTQRQVERSLAGKDESVNSKFFAEFIAFLLGKIHPNCPEYDIIRETGMHASAWGNNHNPLWTRGWLINEQPPIGRQDECGDEIKAYIQTYLDRHHRMIEKTIKLKMLGPQTLNEHWVFFKYIVKGHIKEYGTRPLPELFLNLFDWTNPGNNYNMFSDENTQTGFNRYGRAMNMATATKEAQNPVFCDVARTDMVNGDAALAPLSQIIAAYIGPQSSFGDEKRRQQQKLLPAPPNIGGPGGGSGSGGGGSGSGGGGGGGGPPIVVTGPNTTTTTTTTTTSAPPNTSGPPATSSGTGTGAGAPNPAINQAAIQNLNNFTTTLNNSSVALGNAIDAAGVNIVAKVKNFDDVINKQIQNFGNTIDFTPLVANIIQKLQADLQKYQVPDLAVRAPNTPWAKQLSIQLPDLNVLPPQVPWANTPGLTQQVPDFNVLGPKTAWNKTPGLTQQVPDLDIILPNKPWPKGPYEVFIPDLNILGGGGNWARGPITMNVPDLIINEQRWKAEHTMYEPKLNIIGNTSWKEHSIVEPEIKVVKNPKNKDTEYIDAPYVQYLTNQGQGPPGAATTTTTTPILSPYKPSAPASSIFGDIFGNKSVNTGTSGTVTVGSPAGPVTVNKQDLIDAFVSANKLSTDNEKKYLESLKTYSDQALAMDQEIRKLRYEKGVETEALKKSIAENQSQLESVKNHFMEVLKDKSSLTYITEQLKQKQGSPEIDEHLKKIYGLLVKDADVSALKGEIEQLKRTIQGAKAGDVGTNATNATIEAFRDEMKRTLGTNQDMLNKMNESLTNMTQASSNMKQLWLDLGKLPTPANFQEQVMKNLANCVGAEIGKALGADLKKRVDAEFQKNLTDTTTDFLKSANDIADQLKNSASIISKSLGPFEGKGTVGKAMSDLTAALGGLGTELAKRPSSSNNDVEINKLKRELADNQKMYTTLSDLLDNIPDKIIAANTGLINQLKKGGGSGGGGIDHGDANRIRDEMDDLKRQIRKYRTEEKDTLENSIKLLKTLHDSLGQMPSYLSNTVTTSADSLKKEIANIDTGKLEKMSELILTTTKLIETLNADYGKLSTNFVQGFNDSNESLKNLQDTITALSRIIGVASKHAVALKTGTAQSLATIQSKLDGMSSSLTTLGSSKKQVDSAKKIQTNTATTAKKAGAALSGTLKKSAPTTTTTTTTTTTPTKPDTASIQKSQQETEKKVKELQAEAERLRQLKAVRDQVFEGGLPSGVITDAGSDDEEEDVDQQLKNNKIRQDALENQRRAEEDAIRAQLDSEEAEAQMLAYYSVMDDKVARHVSGNKTPFKLAGLKPERLPASDKAVDDIYVNEITAWESLFGTDAMFDILTSQIDTEDENDIPDYVHRTDLVAESFDFRALVQHLPQTLTEKEAYILVKGLLVFASIIHDNNPDQSEAAVNDFYRGFIDELSFRAKAESATHRKKREKLTAFRGEQPSEEETIATVKEGFGEEIHPRYPSEFIRAMSEKNWNWQGQPVSQIEYLTMAAQTLATRYRQDGVAGGTATSVAIGNYEADNVIKQLTAVMDNLFLKWEISTNSAPIPAYVLNQRLKQETGSETIETTVLPDWELSLNDAEMVASGLSHLQDQSIDPYFQNMINMSREITVSNLVLSLHDAINKGARPSSPTELRDSAITILDQLSTNLDLLEGNGARVDRSFREYVRNARLYIFGGAAVPDNPFHQNYFNDIKKRLPLGKIVSDDTIKAKIAEHFDMRKIDVFMTHMINYQQEPPEKKEAFYNQHIFPLVDEARKAQNRGLAKIGSDMKTGRKTSSSGWNPKAASIYAY